MTKLFILSPGHNKNTPGKKAPDGVLQEWALNRRIVDRIVYYCKQEDIPYVVLDYEGDDDIPLHLRTVKANKYGRDACYISVHSNAAGNGKQWMKARGWSIYTSKGFTKADPIAAVFIEEAEKLLPEIGCKVRKYKQTKYEQDYEENFYVLAHTVMPAVLVENLFFDNKTENEILQSEKGIDVLARIHFNAMKRILEEGL